MSELHAVGARALADIAAGARSRRDQHSNAAVSNAAGLQTSFDARLRGSFPLGKAPARADADIALCRAEVCRARGHSATGRWSAAVRAAERAGSTGRGIYARWRWSEALLEQSAREPAADVLRDAARRAAWMEHPLLAREVDALSRRARIRLAADRSSASEPAAFELTPRETEVLQLIADGLTNKQIATSLYISEKTAEHHVSRILGKLGVDTRTPAGSLAHRLGVSASGSARAPDRARPPE